MLFVHVAMTSYDDNDADGLFQQPVKYRMKDLRHLRNEIDKCVKCGTCRSICPTFRIIGREPASARGKLTLIKAYLDGDIALSDSYIKHVKECTACGACRDSCPNSVDTVSVFLAARADIVNKKGLPIAASLIFKNLLNTGGLLSGAIKLATRFQNLFLKDSDAEKGLLARFSMPGVGSGRLLPPLAKTFFLELPEVKDLGQKRPRSKPVRVAFYSGCGINYLMPEVGSATLEVLKRAGVDVIVPAGQVCCGMPAYYMGDVASAKAMALKTLEAFEAHSNDFDYITTSCATCGHGLKHGFKELLSDTLELKGRVEAFTSKVKDINELLAHLGFKSDRNTGDKKTVTYHDPCHLNRAQGIRSEPRELLRSNKDVVFKEMSFPCSCCGLGGGLSTTNYDLSIEISKRKIDSIKNSGAEIVATSCPGCMVQLRDGLHKYGVKTRVAHVVELL